MTSRFPLRSFVLLLPGLIYLAPADQRGVTLGGGVLLIVVVLGCGVARRALAGRGDAPHGR